MYYQKGRSERERGTETEKEKDAQRERERERDRQTDSCLLYTSDAADEDRSVDLGGRRIIKKIF